MAEYSLEHVDVQKVSTRYRTIQTKLPVPESLVIFEFLSRHNKKNLKQLCTTAHTNNAGCSNKMTSELKILN